MYICRIQLRSDEINLIHVKSKLIDMGSVWLCLVLLTETNNMHPVCILLMFLGFAPPARGRGGEWGGGAPHHAGAGSQGLHVALTALGARPRQDGLTPQHGSRHRLLVIVCVEGLQQQRQRRVHHVLHLPAHLTCIQVLPVFQFFKYTVFPFFHFLFIFHCPVSPIYSPPVLLGYVHYMGGATHKLDGQYASTLTCIEVYRHAQLCGILSHMRCSLHRQAE